MESPKLWPSFLACKCPRCRTGDVFKYPLTQFHRFSATNDYCPNCNLKYEPEPGFYWGAMYVSYAFSTGLMLIAGILFISNDWPFTTLFIIAPLIALIVLPFGYRYSRMVMLYFISPKGHKFDESYIK